MKINYKQYVYTEIVYVCFFLCPYRLLNNIYFNLIKSSNNLGNAYITGKLRNNCRFFLFYSVILPIKLNSNELYK